MPAGPMPLGLVYFAAIKMTGYTIAGYQLKRLYQVEAPNPFRFGAARTVLGIVAGVSFGFLTATLNIRQSELVYYLTLAPIRFAEWSFIIWYFFDRTWSQPSRLARYSLFGSLWSFLLDVPAILAVFVLPGGIWIC